MPKETSDASIGASSRWDSVVDQDPVLAQIAALRQVVRGLKDNVQQQSSDFKEKPKASSDSRSREGDSVGEREALAALDSIRGQISRLQQQLVERPSSELASLKRLERTVATLVKEVETQSSLPSQNTSNNTSNNTSANTVATRAGLERLRGHSQGRSVESSSHHDHNSPSPTSSSLAAPSSRQVRHESFDLRAHDTNAASYEPVDTPSEEEASNSEPQVFAKPSMTWLADRNAWLNVSWYAAAVAVIIALTLLSHQWIFGDGSTEANRLRQSSEAPTDQVADPNRVPSARITGVLPEIVPSGSGSRIADRNVVEMNYEEPIDWENEGVLALPTLDQRSSSEFEHENSDRNDSQQADSLRDRRGMQ